METLGVEAAAERPEVTQPQEENETVLKNAKE